VDNGKTHLVTEEPLYSARASYAMGRVDDDDAMGIGPQQVNYEVMDGFRYSDSVSCVVCHVSWTNNCVGCHLKGEYCDEGDWFSNIMGEEIVFN
jgi:hypothetical protein